MDAYAHTHLNADKVICIYAHAEMDSHRHTHSPLEIWCYRWTHRCRLNPLFFFFCWQERHPSLMVNAYVPFNTISFLSLYCSRRKWGGSDEDYFAIYTLTHTHTNMHAHTHKHTVKISTPALILSEKHFCCSFLKYYHGVRFSVWV